MTVLDVRKLDDDDARAQVQIAAKGGDDHAATLLFYWTQWHKINSTKHMSAKNKILTFADILNFLSANVSLSFTYAR